MLVELRNASAGTRRNALARRRGVAYHGWLDDGFVPQSAKARARASYTSSSGSRLKQWSVPSVTQTSSPSTVCSKRRPWSRSPRPVSFEENTRRRGDDGSALPLWSAPGTAELYQGVYHDVIDLAACGRTLTARCGSQDGGRWPLVDLFSHRPKPGASSMDYLDANGPIPPDYDPASSSFCWSRPWRLTTEQHNAWSAGLARSARCRRSGAHPCWRRTLPLPRQRESTEDWGERLKARVSPEDRRVELRLLAVRRRLIRPVFCSSQ